METPRSSRWPVAGEGNRLNPEELGLLAKQLPKAENATEVARLWERMTRGFYDI